MEEIFVYAIYSLETKRIYVGMSENPVVRLLEHNAGKTKSTKGFIPWDLFFVRKFATRQEARE